MQDGKRSIAPPRRSGSVKGGSAVATARSASVASQRSKSSRSHSVQAHSQRAEPKAAPTRSPAAQAATAGAAPRKPTATIRDQLPGTLRPSQLLSQRAALRSTAVKANLAHIPELVRQIRQSYSSWSSEPASPGSPGLRIKGLSQSSPSAFQVVVEGRQPIGSACEDGAAKTSKAPQESVLEVVLPVQQLEAILFPAAMDLPPDCSNRRNTKRANGKYWKILLQKSNSTVPLLVAAARCEIVGTSAVAAEELLTLLYNILKNAPSDKQRRLVRLSDKLGLMNVCGTVLRAYSKTNSDMSRSAASAACEAVGLLLALAESYNPKVAVVVRISRMLSGLMDAFQNAATQFAAVLSREHCDVAIQQQTASITGDKAQVTSAHLVGCETLRRATLAQSTSTLHLILALFTLSKSSANATELGPRCVGFVSMVVQRIAYALMQLIPLTCRPCCVESNADSSTPDSGGAAGRPGSSSVSSHNGGVPSWLSRWLGHLELVAFWGLGLLQRLCSHPSTRSGCSAQARGFDLLVSLQQLVHVGVADTVLAKRFELVQAAVTTMSVMLCCDRADGLRQLEATGGLPAIVDDVLLFSSATSAQWLHLYACLCSVYGVSALPTQAGREANVMDKRLPSALLQAYVKDARGKKADPPSSRSPPPEPALGQPPTTAETTSLDSTQPQTGTVAASDEAVGAAPAATASLSHCDTGLLPIDEHPDWFSPELTDGVVQAVTRLPAFSETRMPWAFADAPPPPTAEAYAGVFTASGQSADTSPLTPPSDVQRTAVIRHHIARLKHLTPSAHDKADSAADRHVYNVVYERGETLPEPESGAAQLRFASNFESGNLQRAVKVTDAEYDLVLSWDTASNSYTQWFCFSVADFQPGATYRFNIVNMEKNDSTFNEGQRPLLLHVPAGDGSLKPCSCDTDWKRAGQEIFYFKSPYARHLRDHLIQKESNTAPSTKTAAKKPAAKTSAKSKSTTTTTTTAAGRKGKKAGTAAGPKKTGKGATATGGSSAGSASGKKQQTYYTASFAVTMPARGGGRVYLCNCFPFTYSELRRHVEQLEEAAKKSGTALMVQSLCVSPGGLAVPLLTTTSLRDSTTGLPCSAEKMRDKPVVVLDARVHPGETNGSWMMQGMLDLLLAPPTETTRAVAKRLLDTFVFKIIPMLNIDGVVMGNHRCSIPGFDLNRDYLHPDTQLNPVVYSMKRLIQHMTEVEHRKVVLYGDFHGHSKAKNFLLYGCTRRTIDVLRPKRGKKSGTAEPCAIPAEMFAPEKFMPSLLSQMCPAFRIEQSNFGVLRSKRGTARISIYKEYGVRMSLGVEGTMMGGRGAAYTLQDAIELCGDGTVAVNWCGAAAPNYTIETHYNQDTYRTFGAMFLIALHSLVQCETAVTACTGSMEPQENHEALPTDALVEASGVRLAWTQAQSTGSTREPPRVTAAQLVEPSRVAGPYALATRAERRDGESTPIPTSPLTGPELVAPGVPPLTLTEKAQALRYLLRSAQLSLKDDEAGDDADDDDADGDDGDDDNSEGGDLTGEAEAAVSTVTATATAGSAWSAVPDRSCSSASASSSESDNDDEEGDAHVGDDDDDDDTDDDDEMAGEEEDNDCMASVVIPADILSL